MSPSPESALAEILQRLAHLEHHVQQYAPITPLYSLDQACTLLPTRYATLQSLLQRHYATLDEPMYRHGVRHRRYRMLSHADLLKLRALLVKPRRRSRAKVMQEFAA